MKEFDVSNLSPDIIRLNPELKQQVDTKPASKYKNARAEANGMRFQSGREAVEVGKLILAEEHKAIFGLRLQVRFPLQGKNIYVADAVYLEPTDAGLALVVADVKGFRTKEYLIKKKLFKEKYGVDIKEI